MKRLSPCGARYAPTMSAVIAVLCCAVASSGWAVDRDGHSCGDNESWDNGMRMCMPVASFGVSQSVIAGRFNVFGVFSAAQGPRGSDDFAAPNMFMVDVGKSLGARQFLNLDVMGTTELWTYPRRGYPELLQIGEERSDGSPYIDAQHPHGSPIMGVTLSDTISLNSMNALKLFFAPRGESTDGPVAFMHRDSARDDPDAPLGHHVGQDVGHISSTVLGAQLNLGRFGIEASAFNGSEPMPTKVALPIGKPNSEALRVTYTLGPAHRVMVSWAHVEQQDSQYPGTTSATRSSASLYDHFTPGDAVTIDHTFIFGSITRSPAGNTLTSLLDEAVIQRGSSDFWGRLEVLQRLRSELDIPPSTAITFDDERWVSALTIGYTRWFPLHGAGGGIGDILDDGLSPPRLGSSLRGAHSSDRAPHFAAEGFGSLEAMRRCRVNAAALPFSERQRWSRRVKPATGSSGPLLVGLASSVPGASLLRGHCRVPQNSGILLAPLLRTSVLIFLVYARACPGSRALRQGKQWGLRREKALALQSLGGWAGCSWRQDLRGMPLRLPSSPATTTSCFFTFRHTAWVSRPRQTP